MARYRTLTIIIIRRNRSCTASDSAYFYTCLRSMVCLSHLFPA